MTTNITSPVGRLVQGSLYVLDPKKDRQNNAVIGKDGKPVVSCFFALAIKKSEAAWWDTAWGKQILAVGAAAFPNNYQHPTFAWKIEDGDSAVPNKNGRKNCDREGFPGHWILKFSSGFLPRVYTLIGLAEPKPLEGVDAIYTGCFVQVNFNVDGNGSTDSPGVYLNHSLVCLLAYGDRIVSGPDVASAGFGGQALPVGASATPPAAFVPPATAPAPAAAPAAPAAPLAPVSAPAAPAPVPVPATPHSAITAAPAPAPVAPAAPAAPPAPAPAPAPVGRQMTAAATTTYDEYRKAGWSDQQLVAAGLMVA